MSAARILRGSSFTGNFGAWRLRKWQPSRIYEEMELVEEEEAELLIVSSISFIQAKPQRSIVAFIVLSKKVSVKGIDMTLIQEPLYREFRIRGLNIPVYILFFARGIDRTMACILTRKETAWMLPGVL